MLRAIVTMARCESPLRDAVKRGSPDSAQLIFNTGPSMRQARIAHVTLDDVGDRLLEHHLDELAVTTEQLLDVGAVRRLTQPRVAPAGAQGAAYPREELLVAEVAVDIVR